MEKWVRDMLDLNFEIATKYGRISYAIKLKMSADILYNGEETTDFKNIAMMLYGFSFENLIKCLYGLKKGFYELSGKIKKELESHNVLELYTNIGIKLTQNQKDLLERLEESTVLYGRYPTRKGNIEKNYNIEQQEKDPRIPLLGKVKENYESLDLNKESSTISQVYYSTDSKEIDGLYTLLKSGIISELEKVLTSENNITIQHSINAALIFLK